MTPSKICFKCKQEKPLGEFYKHPRMADGRLNKCKACNRRDVAENRLKRIEYYREYDRKRGARSGFNVSKDPTKMRARSKAIRAIRSGKIPRPERCAACAERTRLHAHHDDYTKPLEVIFLCPVCHKERHRKLGWGYVWNIGKDEAG